MFVPKATVSNMVSTDARSRIAVGSGWLSYYRSRIPTASEFIVVLYMASLTLSAAISRLRITASVPYAKGTLRRRNLIPYFEQVNTGMIRAFGTTNRYSYVRAKRKT